MRVVARLGASLAISAATWAITGPPLPAVQLADGTVYFVQPPRLVEATTTQKGTYVWGATYYFTLSVPENAGEPLQQVTFNQAEGTDQVRFELEDTRSFEGTRWDKGTKLALGPVAKDPQTGSISVRFDPPIPPGKTVTIGLRPYQNPRYSGIYLFGVTAFPAGEKAHAQFLGYGRLHFYSSSDSGF
ncbi:DUF2808 domain-containing protein [Microcoleus sp. FACHB-68]|uniref:DUF2808 domain-containing protein n=1 Tax=Microcoleus sp. FACHB-68 TaxID=2692826 RepID=UPI001683DCBB|nr:DUF2808 domain-containing protein [Microcoleus sp. FACHB-68]MBD1939323.1 DUF2808 domain-containing protein [Microcoleus sp. FACHB-68]